MTGNYLAVILNGVKNLYPIVFGDSSLRSE